MGLWSTIKGWFNIGGVKVLLLKYTEPLSKSNPMINGSVLLKSKGDKTVTSLEVKVIEEYTTTEGEGDDKHKETKTEVLGSVKFPEHEDGIGYPLELKANENQEQPFTLYVTLTDRLENYGGVVGGIGKLASLATGKKLEYYLVAEAKVTGTMFKPSARAKLKIGK
jgi:hypothetical protein